MNESCFVPEPEVEGGEHRCSFCDKSYKSSKSLRAHTRCHLGNCYQCKLCLMLCSAPSTLQRHMKTHADRQPCACVVCDRQFVAPKNLKWHIRAVHGGDTSVLTKSLGEEFAGIDLSASFPCQFCDKSYAQVKSLKKHLTSVHGCDGDQITVTACKTTDSSGVNSSNNSSFVFYPSQSDCASPVEESSHDVLYTCELCPDNQLFSSLESVVSHMQVQHTAEHTAENGEVAGQADSTAQVNHTQSTSSLYHSQDEMRIQDMPPSLQNTEHIEPTTALQFIETCQAQESSVAGVVSVTENKISVDNHQVTSVVAATDSQNSVVVLPAESDGESDDESCDYSDGYEEGDDVGIAPSDMLGDVYIKQEMEDSDSVALPSSEHMHTHTHAHTASGRQVGLTDACPALGYNNNLQVLDVQEFRCGDADSACSIQVLEVDAKDLAEHGFIDVFVINNEQPQSPNTGQQVDSAGFIDNILNAVVKHEQPESVGAGCTDGNQIFILKDEGIVPVSTSRASVVPQNDSLARSCRCTICGRRFDSRESLYHHKKTVHIKSNNRFKCKLCMNTYMTWTYLKKHHQRVHYNREKARFKCSYCPEAFPQRHMLRMHVKKHTGQKDHVCDVCNKRFAELFVLNAHRKLVHFPEKLFECSECKKKYKSYAGLKKHMFSHGAEKKYVCHCGKKFYNPESLSHHEKLHSNIRPFACDRCSKSFVIGATLKKHIKRVHEDVKRVDISKKPYVCECGKRFAVESYLTNHIACYHSDIKPHVCHLCPKRFSKRFMLNKHVKKDHPGSLPQRNDIPKQIIPCAECGKKFISSYHLNCHMKRFHAAEDKSDMESENPSTFVCHCGKEFSQERYLKSHLVVHDEVRPYTCDICDKSFPKLFQLNRHVKHVHMKKPKPVDPSKKFVCECGKRFSNKKNLVCHEITHKPRTEFKCPVCGKQFGAKYLLNKHLRRVHEEDPNDYSE